MCTRATVGVSGLRVFGKQGAQVCVLRLATLAAACVARVSEPRTLKEELRIIPSAAWSYLFFDFSHLFSVGDQRNAAALCPRLLTLWFPENCWDEKKYVEPRGRVV